MTFEFHLNNTPHLVKQERDADRYIRTFAAMIDRLDDDVVCDIDIVVEAAKDAIRFIADDAFRLGFESCHENLLEPLKQRTISREDALTAMASYGARCQQAIVTRFEEHPGVPNSLSAAIDEVELPKPALVLQ
ncbi:hypothetical protein [Rhizobium phaseoli]|uniref:hypothetical protein n=1 Tax=Rhizobium phaseoli TaxID=396 RepID=UPI000BE9A49D|nr:hypothetical protein [Rhizobium phaseoli]PDS68915.1 hypothetical protein CO651_26380 [Rhizobium phaseoli]